MEPTIAPGTVVYRTQWIRMVEQGRTTKTRKIVAETQDHQYLGMIKWYPAWRKYSFFPGPISIFEQDCLRSIAEFLDKIQKEHRAMVARRRSCRA